MLATIDNILEWIIENKDVIDFNFVFRLALYLVIESTSIEALKIAIGIIGLIDLSNEKELIDVLDVYKRQVLGKGGKEREVYFDARTKIHLQNYLSTRTDNNSALFVSLLKPYERLKISGVEIRLRELGKKTNIKKVHPHK